MTNTMKERFDEMFHKSHDRNYPFDCWEAFDGLRADFFQFIQSEIDLSKKEGQEEYKQFILNILDGIDIADGECNTKAIRLAINSRVI